MKLNERLSFRNVSRKLLVTGMAGLIPFGGWSVPARGGPAYGLTTRPKAKAYLAMPETADGPMPKLLSETGAFETVRDLRVSAELIPYTLNVSFWSDGARKQRWIMVPDKGGATIDFAATGEWKFPTGTVFVKHFEMGIDELHPKEVKRLETRLLVCNATGGVYGVTYKWRGDNSDAELLSTNLSETIAIKTAQGLRTQAWYYPSRIDCLTCHTKLAGGVLGVKTRQLNCNFVYASGMTDNQIRAWNHIGLLRPKLHEEAIATLAHLAPPNQRSVSSEERARSWLDANCAHCHRPGGTVAYFDARYDTSLEKQGLINGQVLIDEGIDNAKIISPHDPSRSIGLMRVSTVEAIKMPPLAHGVVDVEGAAAVKEWIESMPGPQVVSAPTFSILGGKYREPVVVGLRVTEPGAEIHYTIDGSAPTKNDPKYETPLTISGPTVLRARAYKPGFTKSIAVQEVYIVGE